MTPESTKFPKITIPKVKASIFKSSDLWKIIILSPPKKISDFCSCDQIENGTCSLPNFIFTYMYLDFVNRFYRLFLVYILNLIKILFINNEIIIIYSNRENILVFLHLNLVSCTCTCNTLMTLSLQARTGVVLKEIEILWVFGHNYCNNTVNKGDLGSVKLS